MFRPTEVATAFVLCAMFGPSQVVKEYTYCICGILRLQMWEIVEKSTRLKKQQLVHGIFIFSFHGHVVLCLKSCKVIITICRQQYASGHFDRSTFIWMTGTLCLVMNVRSLWTLLICLFTILMWMWCHFLSKSVRFPSHKAMYSVQAIASMNIFTMRMIKQG